MLRVLPKRRGLEKRLTFPRLSTIPTQQKQQNEKEDVLAMVFYVIGLITILIGFVSAISEANIIYFLTGGISGLLFLGFGEIISLLYSICKKLDK